MRCAKKENGADAELDLRLPLLLGVHLVADSAAVGRAHNVVRPGSHGSRGLMSGLVLQGRVADDKRS